MWVVRRTGEVAGEVERGGPVNFEGDGPVEMAKDEARGPLGRGRRKAAHGNPRRARLDPRPHLFQNGR